MFPLQSVWLQWHVMQSHVFRICFMRNMKTFFGVVYKLDSTSKDLPGEMKQLQITVSCLGVGFANLAKGIL